MATTVNVKVGGVWKAATAVSVKVGGVWKAATQASVKVGGVWKDCIGLYPVISPSSTAIFKLRASSGFAWAAVEFRSTGVEYENVNATNTTQTLSRGTWLDTGLNSEVWIQDASSVGDAWNVTPGTTRLVLSTTRIWKMRASTGGLVTRTALFNFYNAASGGDLIGSVTYEITAESIF